jgi:NADH-quinone oxidoreductase subunit L
MVMLFPLMILAVLSAVGGLVGIHHGFEHFLEPVFGSEFPTAITEGSGNTEWLLMGISVLFSFAGLILAYVLYVSKPYLPDKIAAKLNGFYEAVLNKYYVDEIYAKIFVKPLIDGSTRILWQGIDRKVIDDTVNNAADGARHVSGNWGQAVGICLARAASRAAGGASVSWRGWGAALHAARSSRR